MTDPATGAAPGPWWLAFRVLDEPGQVFAELARRPRALIPYLLLIAVSLGIAVGAPTSTLQRGTEAQLDAVAQRRPGAITPEIRERAVQQAGGTRNRVSIFIAGAAFGTIIMALVAAVLSLLFNAISGTEIGFRDEWAIVAHANVPQILGAVVTWVGIVLSGDLTFRVALGFLVSADTSRFGHSLAQQFTLFGAWNVYLLALGNQVKMKAPGIGTSLAIIGGFWVVINLLLAWLSAALGGVMG